MNFVWMLLIGLAVGIVVKLILPGRHRDDTVVTLLLGIGGSLLIGHIGLELGWYGGPYEGRGLAASIVGAVLVLFLYNLLEGRLRRAS
jgi:uncharacterized membrane protein YeaQ/YmgE (transglycosylase-associated protein family)